MPLKKGTGPKVVAQNIKAELAAGRPRAQAIAIALDQARRSQPKPATPRRKPRTP